MKNGTLFRWTLSLLLAMTVCLSYADAQTARTLRWKLNKGQTFKIEMKQNVKQSTLLPGQTMDVANTVEMFMTWQVDDIDDQGTIDMGQTVDRVRMNIEMADIGKIEFDSDAEKEPEGLAAKVAAMVRPMVGIRIGQTMSDRGEVFDVTIPAEALKGLNKNQLVKQFFSDEVFKDMMRKASPELPEEAITKDYNWQKTNEMKTPIGVMVMSNNYTYMGQEVIDGEALEKIRVEITMSFNANEAGGGPVIEIPEQDNAGFMYFNNAKGHFVRTDLKQRMSMDIKIEDQSIKQTVANDLLMIVKEAESAVAVQPLETK